MCKSFTLNKRHCLASAFHGIGSTYYMHQTLFFHYVREQFDHLQSTNLSRKMLVHHFDPIVPAGILYYNPRPESFTAWRMSGHPTFWPWVVYYFS